MDGIPLDACYTWADARTRGVTRRQIGIDGIPLARGLYLSRGAVGDLAARCRAWAKVLPADAAFAMGTAAALHGAAPETADVHVALGPRRVLPQHAGITVHARALAAEDIVECAGVRLTSGAQTFLDLAPRLMPWELVALGDALMRNGALTPESLTRRLTRADRVRGVVRARKWAPHLTSRSGSHQESVLRYWLLASDLPDPEVQLPVYDRWGREVVHADLGYEEWKIALEYEGRQHAERGQFGRDVDRYSLMAADGWLVLRFAARHVSGPTVPVDRTRRALLSRGWRPTPS
jgi:very-short-patch-repair endonuclease/Zn-finger nucleic acid-binding protein